MQTAKDFFKDKKLFHITDKSSSSTAVKGTISGSKFSHENKILKYNCQRQFFIGKKYKIFSNSNAKCGLLSRMVNSSILNLDSNSWIA